MLNIQGLFLSRQDRFVGVTYRESYRGSRWPKSKPLFAFLRVLVIAGGLLNNYRNLKKGKYWIQLRVENFEFFTQFIYKHTISLFYLAFSKMYYLENALFFHWMWWKYWSLSCVVLCSINQSRRNKISTKYLVWTPFVFFCLVLSTLWSIWGPFVYVCLFISSTNSISRVIKMSARCVASSHVLKLRVSICVVRLCRLLR